MDRCDFEKCQLMVYLIVVWSHSLIAQETEMKHEKAQGQPRVQGESVQVPHQGWRNPRSVTSARAGITPAVAKPFQNSQRHQSLDSYCEFVIALSFNDVTEHVFSVIGPPVTAWE